MVASKDTLCEKPQIYDYKRAASFICQYFEEKEKGKLVRLADLLPLRDKDCTFIKVPKKISEQNGIFVKITLMPKSLSTIWLVLRVEISTAAITCGMPLPLAKGANLTTINHER